MAFTSQFMKTQKQIHSVITLNELANLSNLTPRRLRQLSEEGKLPKITGGALPMPDAVSQLFKHYQKDSEELTRERLLLVTANRETRQLELAAAKGSLISRDVARNTILSFALQYKNVVRHNILKAGPANRRDKLEQLGVSIEILQAFNAYDIAGEIALNEAIEKQCAAASEETL
jgi:hypothetical protein